MASAKKRVAKAGTAAYALRKNPAVQRFMQDDKVRGDLRDALKAAQGAYGRANGGKDPVDLVNDKKLQKELQKSVDSLRSATSALQEGPKRKRGRGGIGGLLLLTIVGAVVALVVSEDLRNKVLDLLFGAEEEFDYTSTTAPSSPPPATQSEPTPTS